MYKRIPVPLDGSVTAQAHFISNSCAASRHVDGREAETDIQAIETFSLTSENSITQAFWRSQTR